MSADLPTGRCAGCNSLIEHGQRYCLNCGERVGSRSPQLTQLLQHVRQPSADQVPSAGQPVPAPASAPRWSSLSLAGFSFPSSRVSALLVVVFLGFGVLLGLSSRSREDQTLATQASAHLDLVLAHQTPPSTPSPASETPPPAPLEEPPPTQSTPTPEPEEAATTTEKAPSKPHKTSKKSEGQKSKSSPSTGGSTSKLPGQARISDHALR